MTLSLSLTLTVYLVLSLIAAVIVDYYGPDIEPTFIQDIIRWNKINTFGKIVLIFFVIPFTIFQLIMAGIVAIFVTLFTWHPRKKN